MCITGSYSLIYGTTKLSKINDSQKPFEHYTDDVASADIHVSCE